MTSLLRRGIGALVHDRSANATRDFSDSSEAFRSGDLLRVMGAHPGKSDTQRVSRSERLSTLPGDVPSDAPSWGALLLPTHGRSISTKGGATNSPHTSEIAAGRSIGPSRRLNNIVAFPVARDHAAGD